MSDTVGLGPFPTFRVFGPRIEVVIPAFLGFCTHAPSGFRVSFLAVPTRANRAPWVASIRKPVDTPVIWTTNEGRTRDERHQRRHRR